MLITTLNCLFKMLRNESIKMLKLVQSDSAIDLIPYIEKILTKYHWTEIAHKQTGDTILHYAAKYGKEDIVVYLLKKDSKYVDCKNKDDKTALHEAAQFSQFEICNILIGYGANINALKRADWTPLMLACTKHYGEATIKTVQVLLNQNALVNYENKDGWTSLHISCREGDCNILKLLIKYGLNVRLLTKNGRSALHIAALHGQLDIIEILLSYGLDVNKKDKCGNTSLGEAVLGNHLQVTIKLLDNNADKMVINESGYSLIHLTASEGHIEMLEFILTVLTFDVNFANLNNLTALHCAARKGHRHTYDFLIKNGALETITDKFQRTPLDYFRS